MYDDCVVDPSVVYFHSSRKKLGTFFFLSFLILLLLHYSVFCLCVCVFLLPVLLFLIPFLRFSL